MLRTCILGGFISSFVVLAAPARGETLYNGIELPAVWPPMQTALSLEPASPPPYLTSPPEVIPIDVGRQLFVDDFLIEKSTLERRHHQAEYHPQNPVLGPDKPWEGKGGRARAAPFSDGVWYDPEAKLFKMWYWAGRYSENPPQSDTCLAVSRDGITWEKPEFDVVPGTNIVLRDEEPVMRNSSTVWRDDLEKDPAKRWKMFRVVKRSNFNRVRVSTSPDGVHWTYVGETDDVGDRSTVFQNPFRERWVYGIRSGTPDVGRCRRYNESVDPLPRGRWNESGNYGRGRTFWVGADKLDASRNDLKLEMDARRPRDFIPPQLYNLDCVAYESVMLGLFSIWRGLPVDRPKINEVCVGYSRDGFHWSRPDRRAFCGVSEDRNAWNWGNVQTAGGCCLVVDDKLYFYVAGISGKQPVWHPDPSYVGLATLRRDGFASLHADAEGAVTTRPVQFSGNHLFVNVAAAEGEMTAEIFDRDGQPIAPFARENCEAVRNVDKTSIELKWRGDADLAKLANQPVRIRFHLRSGDLYAFWVTSNAAGASHGYVAAGGPGFTGGKDVPATK